MVKINLNKARQQIIKKINSNNTRHQRKPRQAKPRQAKPRQGSKAKQGKARQAKPRQGKARQDKTRQDKKSKAIINSNKKAMAKEKTNQFIFVVIKYKMLFIRNDFFTMFSSIFLLRQIQVQHCWIAFYKD
jgi:hypothetical protein